MSPGIRFYHFVTAISLSDTDSKTLVTNPLFPYNLIQYNNIVATSTKGDNSGVIPQFVYPNYICFSSVHSVIERRNGEYGNDGGKMADCFQADGH